MKMRNYVAIGCLILLIAAAGILHGSQRTQSPTPTPSNREQTLKTTDGKAIVVKVEGRVFKADVPDGTYKLTNGGSIKVQSGKLVWDAFGAVNRLKNGRWRGIPDPIG